MVYFLFLKVHLKDYSIFLFEYLSIQHHHEILKAEYWENGHIYEEKTLIRRIDAQEQKLYLESHPIDFRNLINLEYA